MRTAIIAAIFAISGTAYAQDHVNRFEAYMDSIELQQQQFRGERLEQENAELRARLDSYSECARSLPASMCQ